jgi:hypothetical protein
MPGIIIRLPVNGYQPAVRFSKLKTTAHRMAHTGFKFYRVLVEQLYFVILGTI